ncbi:MAG TPA: hypothetical protein VF175_15090 [Lacipirellula sp.]
MSRQAKDKLGATPGKLALIAVLALVLVGVIASNWTSGGGPPATKPAASAKPAQAVESAAAPAATPAAKPAAGPFGEFAEDGDWPELPRSEITKFDPMMKAAWAKPAVTAEGDVVSDVQISELLAAKNAIIFMAGDKRVARIGDNEYQIGDVIGRYQISDITSRGVVLSEVQ